MLCQACKRPLAYPGKGRPPLRHPECQTEHRRKYVRNAVRKLRERGPCELPDEVIGIPVVLNDDLPSSDAIEIGDFAGHVMALRPEEETRDD